MEIFGAQAELQLWSKKTYSQASNSDYGDTNSHHKLEEASPAEGVYDFTPVVAAPQGFASVVDQYDSEHG